MKEFDKNKLLKDIKNLSKRNKLFYMLWCTERQFYNFANFSIKYNFGGISELRNALDNICYHLYEDRKFNFQHIYDSCEKYIIDTDEYGDYDGSIALNSITSILLLLESIIKDIADNNLVEIALLAVESIDFIISEQFEFQGLDLKDEKAIHNHELMQSELSLQNNDLLKTIIAEKNKTLIA